MILALAFSLLLSHAAAQDYHRTLTTPHYTVRITERCEDGAIPCENVLYEAKSSSGASITLRGRQIYHMCIAMPDTPCHPVGYKFFTGKAEYWVGENGELIVKRRQKTLVYEQGKWENE